eukprot:4466407-Alexandrium_andersonii.AAC.1
MWTHRATGATAPPVMRWVPPPAALRLRGAGAVQLHLRFSCTRTRLGLFGGLTCRRLPRFRPRWKG